MAEYLEYLLGSISCPLFPRLKPMLFDFTFWKYKLGLQPGISLRGLSRPWRYFGETHRAYCSGDEDCPATCRVRNGGCWFRGIGVCCPVGHLMCTLANTHLGVATCHSFEREVFMAVGSHSIWAVRHPCIMNTWLLFFCFISSRAC